MTFLPLKKRVVKYSNGTLFQGIYRISSSYCNPRRKKESLYLIGVLKTTVLKLYLCKHYNIIREIYCIRIIGFRLRFAIYFVPYSHSVLIQEVNSM